MQRPSLYEQVLGDSYARLDPILQRFHRQAKAAGRGAFSVGRPPGYWYSLVGWLLGLPAPGGDVPLRLEVTATSAGETWQRWFGGQRLATVQRFWRGMLIEAGGPVQLGLEVRVRHGGLTMRSVRAWLLGIPLPARMAPAASAIVLPASGGWHVRVRLCLPGIGEVTRYEGKVHVDECGVELADRAGVPGRV